MKKIPGLMLVLFFILISTLAADTAEMRTINVSGDGEITVDADRLSFYIRIETRNKELDQAKAVNDQRLGKVEEIFKLFSIPNDRINISGYRVDPRYKNYSSGNPIELEGFSVYRKITIKLDDILKYEPLVDALIAAEVYNVGGLRYSLTNSAEMHARARENALNKAKQKAEQMAGVYGMKVGKIIEIDEITPSYRYSSFGASSALSNVAASNLTDTDAEDIMGKMVFRAAVNVVFELQD